MTIIQKLRARAIIAMVAHRQGISVRECRAAIQEAISEAWGTGDPLVKQRQIQLVGEGRVPTPEEFIFMISSKLLEDFT